MTRALHIGNAAISLALALPEGGMPEILAFGPESVDKGIQPVAERASRINGMDVAVPAAVLLPTGGMGFFGWPALAGHRDGRDFVTLFGEWESEGSAAAMTVRARDAVCALSIEVTFRSFESGVIEMRTVVRNEGSAPFTLDRCMSATMLVDAGEGEIVRTAGMWGREFHVTTEPIGAGLRLQESRRGRTSHDRFPGLFLTVGRKTVGLHLGWSGNHLLAVDTIDDGRRLVHAGALFEPGEVCLAPGESYRSPAAYLTAAETVDAAAARLRRFVSRDLVRLPAAAKGRPVTLNTWEANYFDHRPALLIAQAEAAAKLGIERFVLDDGWFGRRDDATSSLGDWTVDRRKYPEGLGPLVDRVRALGMEFGLWFEPEMVNPDSDLYRAHPDWVLQVAGRPLLLSRHQLVLDLTRTEVCDHLFQQLSAVLSAHDIGYMKWDMNRDVTQAGDADGRAAMVRQTSALYALLARIRAAHPHVEIESCASGGGRADYGVLQHTHRLWTSDCTDALERLEIQRGASLYFPAEILGAHISASPNHQTGRRHSLSFRAVVALAYHLGIELDPLTLAEAERSELAAWIALHKRLRPILHGGQTFHQAPADGRHVWGAVGGSAVAVFVAQATYMLTEQPAPLRLPMVGAEAGQWRIAAVHPEKASFTRVSTSQAALLAGKVTFDLRTLRQAGLPLPMLAPESGVLLELERVKGN